MKAIRCRGASGCAVTVLPEPYRVALYWAPERDDPLRVAGATWLGRDAEADAPLPQPAVPGIAEITADARGYGLHATLKPPFRPGAPYAELRQQAAALAAGIAPFVLPPLALRDLSGFLALRETAPCPALQALADHCVAALDHLRLPPDEAEVARRQRPDMAAAERANLRRWGYPHVFGSWRFHVTLTRRLSAAERAVVEPALTTHLGDIPAQPRMVRELCLFTQAAPGAAFTLAERLPLGG